MTTPGDIDASGCEVSCESAPPTSIAGEIVSFPVGELKSHPDNERLFGPDSPEEEAKLDEQVVLLGIRTPLLVVGDDCELPHGTLVGGHRRARAARRRDLEFVPAVLLHGLTADEIREQLIADNLAAGTARRLSPRKRYEIEKIYRELLGRRSGSRSDLLGQERGEASEVVAKKLGESPHAVKTRKLIFESPVAPESLKEAVDAGTLAPRKAAETVRKLQKAHAQGASLDECSSLAEEALAPKPNISKAPITEPTVLPASTTTTHQEVVKGRLSEMFWQFICFTPKDVSPTDHARHEHDVAAALRARDALMDIAHAHLPTGVKLPQSEDELDQLKGHPGVGLPPEFWDLLSGSNALAALMLHLSDLAKKGA